MTEQPVSVRSVPEADYISTMPKASKAQRGSLVVRGKRDVMPAGYNRFLGSLKERIRKAQLQAVLSVNAGLIELYWRIGREILLRQRREGWGAKVVDRLGHDLLKAFPGMSGLSPRNLLYKIGRAHV